MQTKGLHVAVKENLFAEVEQLRVWLSCRMVQQGADIQTQFLKDTLLDDAVAVEQVGEEGIFIYGIQMGFCNRELAGALHIAENGKHQMSEE